MDSAEEKLPPTSAIPDNPDPASPSNNASPSGSPAAHSLRNEIRVWTRDLLIAIGLALVIIVFLYQPVKVEGTSMAPLLSDQERIFIKQIRLSLRAHRARRRGCLLVSAGPHKILLSSVWSGCPARWSRFARESCMLMARRWRSLTCRRNTRI